MNSKTNKQAVNQQANTQPENQASDKPALPAKVILTSGVATLLSPGSTGLTQPQ
ncbi:hypothetical protein [Aeromonas veronii]|uniref:hypothetical protein n=1 Tax=Aeromonas veronii TaxID=654 RepID=UPI0032ED43FA